MQKLLSFYEEKVSALNPLGNGLFRETPQVDAKNSKFENFASILCAAG